MEFRTRVAIRKPSFLIDPCEDILFVGSCFADSIGRRFRQEAFPAIVNPFGVMYNPASILHTLQRIDWSGIMPRTVFLTLGTNHVYRLKSTGEIVDNCEKRPAALFQEEKLTVDQCADYLSQSVSLLCNLCSDIRVVFTVSPIRYRKYGYHESQLSKATLLLAVQKIIATTPVTSAAGSVSYFPAYEILMDELRDYRFYAADMLHPSEQAVEYIWECLVDSYFSQAAKDYLAEWYPLRQALMHKPFNADSPEYQNFHKQTMEKVAEFKKKYPHLAL